MAVLQGQYGMLDVPMSILGRRKWTFWTHWSKSRWMEHRTPPIVSAWRKLGSVPEWSRLNKAADLYFIFLPINSVDIRERSRKCASQKSIRESRATSSLDCRDMTTVQIELVAASQWTVPLFSHLFYLIT